MTFFQMAQALSPFLLLVCFLFFYRINKLEQRVYFLEQRLLQLTSKPTPATKKEGDNS